VLKPAESIAAAQYAAEVISTLPDSEAVRVPRPVSTVSGAWVSAGWVAWSWVPGEPAIGCWREVIAAGAALHALLADAPRPAYLDARDDVWAVGDRVAWGEQPLVIEHERFRATAHGLAARLAPCSERSQLVHGDLTGNVLQFEGLPPAVIDISCYWRPPRWALAIVAADALAWHDAGPEVVGLLPGPRPVAMVARAALYRLVTSDRHAASLDSEQASYLAGNGAAYDRVLTALDSVARPDGDDCR
jgi:phosphotransferase family enzyme